MWTQERHHRILSLLGASGRLRADAVAKSLGVSRETVRRDLLELEAAGQLKRVHGGAIARETTPEEPFSQRAQVRRREKEAIAAAAVDLLRSGQTCFIDAGTTTLTFARALTLVPGLRIITNSLDIASVLYAAGQHDVVVLGGSLMSDVPAMFGELTLAAIERFVVDVAVIGPVALHPRHGVMNYEMHEAEVARAMIERALDVLVLADHTKLGVASRVVVCDLAKVRMLVTDDAAAPEALQALEAGGLGAVTMAGGA